MSSDTKKKMFLSQWNIRECQAVSSSPDPQTEAAIFQGKIPLFAQKSPETSFLASHHGKHSHVAVLSQTAAGTESTDSPQRSRMLNLSKKNRLEHSSNGANIRNASRWKKSGTFLHLSQILKTMRWHASLPAPHAHFRIIFKMFVDR